VEDVKPSINPRQSLLYAARLLNRQDRTKVALVTLVQFALNLLDLIGVALIGILGSLAVNGVQSKEPGFRVQRILDALNLNNLSFQMQVATLGIVATVLLLTKTLISMFLNRRILFFLANKTALISGKLISELFTRDLLWINKRRQQETLYSLTTGVQVLTLGILATSISLVADLSLLLMMSIGLLSVDVPMAFATILIFGGVAYILVRALQFKAQELGNLNSTKTISSNNKILEVLSTYREATIRGRREYYRDEILNERRELAKISAELAYIPGIGKYVIEVAFVLGSLVICGYQFAKNDASYAVATLAVFLAAGSRIAPAVLRLQQAILQFRSALASAGPTIEMIKDLEFDGNRLPTSNVQFLPPSFGDYANFKPTVQIRGLSFVYPNNLSKVLDNVNLEISEGEFLAIVGPSGSGKTTFVDLLLGVFPPTDGEILISDLPPTSVVKEWPGSIGYVPQNTILISGSIAENVCLGFSTIGNEERVMDALNKAQLADFVQRLPQGIHTKIGDGGFGISGGQKQRIGIARALFTSPKILVLDEATSSLDTATESAVSDSIQSLKGGVTTIVIAHRLSTVYNADTVIYLENGKIRASGTFQQIKKHVPDFSAHAKLLDL
jgi:ABC-type multidrug transport system fused ATPase/permease subunit